VTSVERLEHLLFVTLLQLVLILVAARIANLAARRVGQPGAVGEMIAGLVLGPSLLGAVAPEAFAWLFKSAGSDSLAILSQVGLILLMFQIGNDFEFGHLKERALRRALVAVTVGSVLVPLATGIALGLIAQPGLAPNIERMPFALFAGVAMAITAMPMLGRILREYQLTTTPLGVLAISAAAANDVIGWVLLAIVSALATARFSVYEVSLQIVLIGLFLFVCVRVVRPLLLALLARTRSHEHALPTNVLVAVLAAMMLAGICTYKLGIFAIFGGFVVGVLLHDQTKFVVAWKKEVGHFVLVFFVPIFFTFTGLRTDIGSLGDASLWGWAIVFFAAAVASKMAGAYAGARLAGRSPLMAFALGSLMNTRGLMELVVLNIGYDLGFLPQPVFTMLVLMAIGTTMMTAPLLRWVLPGLGHPIPRGVEA
jgi:Kef-type K+ transport system membrane component KefB